MKFFEKVFICVLLLLSAVSCVCSASASAPDTKHKLLAFSGSSRVESYNKKALMLLIDAVKKEGIAVTYIDLADFSMPIYNGDVEQKHGLPENARKLQNLIATHDGFLIASPEYNGFPSPLLINAIDWATREEKGNANSGTKIFSGKFAALIATSPGSSGGSRSLSQLTEFLTNIGVNVLSEQTSLPNAMQLFNEQGQLKNKEYEQKITKQAHSVLKALN